MNDRFVTEIPESPSVLRQRAEDERWAKMCLEDQKQELHTMIHDCITDMVDILSKLERLND